MKSLFAKNPVLFLSRTVLAFSWIYQGAVPKLVCRSEGEIELLGHVIPVYQWACAAVGWMGGAEIAFGLLLLAARQAWVFRLNIAVLLFLLAYVLLFEAGLFTEPFNPLTLNVSLIALSLIAINELKTTKH
ncbi:MAG: hypothetical protein FJZ79_02840 [Chlorobi bacterium]|nr:hypothetical protein [Chlorobiota bacterium]